MAILWEKSHARPLKNILWPPLCRINKFGLYFTLESYCNPLHLWVMSALHGLAVVASDGDEALRTRHLHLQVCIVGDRHEFGERGSAQQCVVRARQVHHLEPYWLAPEMVAIAEQDIEPDPANG